MIEACTVADVRAAEELRLAEVPQGALMQRAAAALAATCARLLREHRGRVTGGRVVLLVGAGDNGGDALWAGERLARRGARVDAVLAGASAHAEGLAALRAAGGRVVDLRGGLRDVGTPSPDPLASAVCREADLVVDGLVGLGGSPGLREPAASLVAGLPPDTPVVAVDLPSGVDPDTGGTPAPHVTAHVTVTFGLAKPCLLLPPASAAAGRVELVDIGLGPHLPDRRAVARLEAADVAALWPWPGAGDDKYRRGVVGVVAGSAAYTGAALLTCSGALSAGAGMVRYLGPEPVADLVRRSFPEVVVGDGRVQALVLGSGVDPRPEVDGTGPGQRERIVRALAEGVPCVVDAGALDLLGDLLATGWTPEATPWLLTPHAGELARLLSRVEGTGSPSRQEVEASPLRHARRAAELTGATVLLKGAVTLVVTPDGRVLSQADAPHWLATAGAGDVLAGIAGSLLAAGLDPLRAGGVAASVHGRAAALASGTWDAAVPGPAGPTRPAGVVRGVPARGGPVRAGDVATAVPRVVEWLGHWS